MNPQTTQQTRKYHLKNGLTVLLEESHTSPVVSINIGVKVGSAWEHPDEAGLSHLLEHMVFKGTKSFGAGEIATKVEALGGDLNAYTSFDQTVYYINLPSRNWKLALQMIKEMTFDAIIDPVELEREKEVVVEEIRRGKDNPHSVLTETLFGLAYQKHTYGRPVIGFENLVRGFPPEFVKTYYKKWYQPENMILGIMGDIDESQIRAAIDELFGDFSSIPPKRHDIPHEAFPTQNRFKHLKMKVEGNYLMMGFPIPDFKHHDIATLDMLAHILGGGETSRLEQIVKNEKALVSSIHSSAYTPYFPGLFIIDAQVSKPDQIIPAILEEIDYCKKNLISHDFLERIKLNMRSSLYYEKETFEGSARKWIVYETTAGDYRYEEKYLEQVEKVTAQDIRRVAQEYLNTNYASTVFLTGEKVKVPANFTKPFIAKAKAISPKKPYTLVEEHKDFKKFVLPNGIRIITKENHRLPIIALKQASLSGLRFENKNNNGITHLTAGLLDKGTTTRSAIQIAEICESIAGQIYGSSGNNSLGISASFISEKKHAGYDLFLDVLLNPLFSEKELKSEKRLTLEAIKNQDDSPSGIAFQKFRAMLFNKHPYGLPVLGTKKTVSNMTSQAIKKFYSNTIIPQNTVFSAVGDFDTQELLDIFSERLGSLEKRAFTKPKLVVQKPVGKSQSAKMIKDKMQAHIVLGFLGTTLSSKDRFALEVLNNILSGQGGRLFLELRDKMSLAYSVTSMMNEGIEPGFFATYIGTEASKTDSALKAMMVELKKVTEDIISEEELDRAKNFIVGNHEIDLQKNSAQCGQVLYNELYGLSLREYDEYSEKIMQVSSHSVLEVARKYLRLNAYTLSIVGP